MDVQNAVGDLERLRLRTNPVYLFRVRQYVFYGLLGLLVLIFIVFMVQKWRKFLKNVNKFKLPPWKNNCPDYWMSVGKNKCKNIHKLGKCGLKEDGIIDFGKAPFLGSDGDRNKCRFVRACNTPWTGIDNLCI